METPSPSPGEMSASSLHSGDAELQEQIMRKKDEIRMREAELAELEALVSSSCSQPSVTTATAAKQPALKANDSNGNGLMNELETTGVRLEQPTIGRHSGSISGGVQDQKQIQAPDHVHSRAESLFEKQPSWISRPGLLDLIHSLVNALLPSSLTRVFASDSPVHKAAFFTVLNKDVRYCIYDHLHGCLPPFPSERVSTVDCTGMILSCKQAYAELSEVAARHFSKELRTRDRKYILFLTLNEDLARRTTIFPREAWRTWDHKYPAIFKGEPGLRIAAPLQQGFSSLRKVTLNVSLARFDPESTSVLSETWDSRAPGWHWFRPLLQCRLDTVTIRIPDMKKEKVRKNLIKHYALDKFLDTIQKERNAHLVAKIILQHVRQARNHERLNQRYPFEPSDVVGVIQQATLNYSRFSYEAGENWTTFESRCGPELQWMVSTPQVQTKKTRFLWGLKLKEESPLKMPNIVERVLFKGDEVPAESLRGDPSEPDGVFAQGSDQLPHAYSVLSSEFFYGEMGIFHPRRWEYGWSHVVRRIEESRDARFNGGRSPRGTPRRNPLDRVMHL